MLFKRIVSPGLAHNSYILGSRDSAAVIDPRRDAWTYAEVARRNDMRITHIFETHRNEDYVIGSLELAETTDADVYHGAALDFGYGVPVEDGDSFTIGALRLDVLETPGHTDESISIVVTNTAVSSEPYMVFTGDALFAGDVGRTDLYGPDERERMAAMLYNSLHEKLLPLGDQVIVCPAHGSGSVCGGSIGDLPLTTIGYERRSNPMLQLDRQSFIKRKKRERLHVPPYFRQMEVYNRRGPPLLHRMPLPMELSPGELAGRMDEVQVVDVRRPGCFAAAHVPGSLNMWSQALAGIAGWFLSYDRPVVLIGDDDNVALRSLVRLGYDDVAMLLGGIGTWQQSGRPTGGIDMWHAERLNARLNDDEVFILDVRAMHSRSEHGHIPGSEHVYLGDLPDRLGDLPSGETIVVYCDAGYKTGTAASLLARHGFDGVAELIGGIAAWKQAGHPVD
ncbi:MAG: MBL fold metallo-hydrolase [Candidatus Thermoplasmatota archaeon]|nr:MBL fold metallo-hydrolase [Candidatus Thermoplasmatota archaeon]